MGALAVAPARADSEDTKEDIAAAKASYAELDAELNQLAAEWNQAEAELVRIRADIAGTRARIAGIRERMLRISERLEARAAEIYMEGPGGTLEVLLSSSSFSEFSDRLEFVGSIVDADEELIIEAEVRNEELAREQQHLEQLSERQAEVVARLEDRQAAIADRQAEVEGLIADLQAQFQREKEQERALAQQQVFGGGGTPLPGSLIRVCPVAGPNSFVDSFGWPRSGGRTHEGIDLISPLGTPVVAAHDGTLRRTFNELGGISAFVTAGSGWYSYYAHMNGYSDVPSGAHVSAGTVIGYVGSTGNAGSVNHLHFGLYSPGGGAVNPYSALVAVC